LDAEDIDIILVGPNLNVMPPQTVKNLIYTRDVIVSRIVSALSLNCSRPLVPTEEIFENDKTIRSILPYQKGHRMLIRIFNLFSIQLRVDLLFALLRNLRSSTPDSYFSSINCPFPCNWAIQCGKFVQLCVDSLMETMNIDDVSDCLRMVFTFSSFLGRKFGVTDDHTNALQTLSSYNSVILITALLRRAKALVNSNSFTEDQIRYWTQVFDAFLNWSVPALLPLFNLVEDYVRNVDSGDENRNRHTNSNEIDSESERKKFSLAPEFADKFDLIWELVAMLIGNGTQPQTEIVVSQLRSRIREAMANAPHGGVQKLFVQGH